MAVAVTGITHSASFTTLSTTTGSFTPSNNSLLVVFVCAVDGGGAIDINAGTVSGGSLTWTQRLRQGLRDNADASMISPPAPNAGYRTYLEVWTAPVTTGASMTVTASNANAVGESHIMQHVLEATGHDTSSPIGASIIGTTSAFNGAASVTLSGSPAATSVVVAGRYFNPYSADTTATPGSGWTEVYDNADGDAGGYLSLQTQFKLNVGSTSVDWTDINVGDDAGFLKTIGAALEILASAASGQPTIKRFGGVPFASSLSHSGGKVWAPVMAPRMVGQSIPVGARRSA